MSTTPELGFDEAGHGTAVVLLHAFPLHRGMWAEVTDGLAEEAHVLAVDLPGFGRSPLPDDGTTLEDAADGVVAVLDGLRIDRAVVAGVSMGGYVALALAARHADRLAGLALIDTKASPDDDAARAKRHDLATAVLGPAGSRALHGVAAGLLSDHTRESNQRAVTAVESMVAEATPRAVAWAATAMADRPDRHATLEALDVPSLVLVGEHDAVTPLEDAERMARLLGVEPVVVPRAGHLPPVEAPDGVTAALRDLHRRTR